MTDALSDTTSDVVDVCVVTTIHQAFDARIYQRSLWALANAGFRVSMISPWPVPPDPPTVRWTTMAAPRNKWDRVAVGFRTFRRCMQESARVFHFHDLDFLPWAVALRALRKVEVVYDCHENYPEEVAYAKAYVPRPLRGALAWIVRGFENVAVSCLNWVVVAVPSQVPRFERLGARCVVSRNLSDRVSMPNLGHRRGAICIGTLSETYGVWVLLEIARELNRRSANVPLIVVDRFVSSEMRRRFMAACRDEALDVTVVPRVMPTELPDLLSQASIGLALEQDSPEKRLALPSKLFDYMAMGLPVVASDLPYTRQVVLGAGSGLLVPPADACAYVDAIVRLLDDWELHEACRQAGFRAIEDDEYRWSNEVHGLVDFFYRVLAAA